MDEIKSAVLGVCISLLLIGFFLKLSPKGKLTKNMRHLLCIVIMLIIIAPLSKGYSINWEVFSIEDNESAAYSKSDYTNRVVRNVIIMMENDIKKFLEEERIGLYNVHIESTEKADGTELNRIIVYIKSGYDPTKVEKIVKDKFQMPCKVIIGTE